MIRPFLAIASVTFSDVLRQPFYGLIVLATLVGQALGPALAMFSFYHDASLLADFAVSTVFLSGLLIVAFGASSVLGKELETRTALVLLSKPVGRGVFLAGRFAGLVAALFVACFLFLIATLLAARQGPPERASHPWDWPVVVGGLGGLFLSLVIAGVWGFRSSRPAGSLFVKVAACALSAGFLIASIFDPGWRLQPFARGFDPLIPKAVLLVFLETVLLSAVAVLLSVIFRRGALLGTLLVFLAGLAFGGDGFSWLLVCPDLQLFWVGELFYRPKPLLPWSYLVEAGLYALSYSLVCLWIGTWVLERREIG